MTTQKTVLAVIRAARPTFRNRNDKIAFAVHSSFLASGYLLSATGPDALSDTALSNPSIDEVSIEHWNALNDDEYAFVYANPEQNGLNSEKKVLVKCLAMNGKLVVHALCEGFSEPLHLEINVGDYAGEHSVGNYAQQFKNLENLVKRIDSEILSKLAGSETRSEGIIREDISDYPAGIIIPVPVGYGIDDHLPVPLHHPSGIVFPLPVGWSNPFDDLVSGDWWEHAFGYNHPE